ncbi:hypothetical protein WKH56_32810 [Priestia sp. SB1]|uniref:hypothetical protein n=1 Tax=Priestia sp. SB1 TaxID=3132359 RepID=UPI00316C3B78
MNLQEKIKAKIQDSVKEKVNNNIPMSVKDMVYEVRKHGAVKVDSRYEAEEIKKAGEEQAYEFRIRKSGWNFLVIDAEA